MSLCAQCGLEMYREPASGADTENASPVCFQHLNLATWSAKANRIWCGYFHRHEPITRIPWDDE